MQTNIQTNIRAYLKHVTLPYLRILKVDYIALLHCIKPHHNTSHYVAMHSIPFPSLPFHSIHSIPTHKTAHYDKQDNLTLLYCTLHETTYTTYTTQHNATQDNTTQRDSALHCITLHHMTVQYTTARCTTLHCSTLPYMQWHDIAFTCVASHQSQMHTSQSVTVYFSMLENIEAYMPDMAFNEMKWHDIQNRRWHAMPYRSAALRSLHYIVLHCVTLHYITLHYISLHDMTWHDTHACLHTCLDTNMHARTHACMHACIHCVPSCVPHTTYIYMR